MHASVIHNAVLVFLKHAVDVLFLEHVQQVHDLTSDATSGAPRRERVLQDRIDGVVATKVSYLTINGLFPCLTLRAGHGLTIRRVVGIHFTRGGEYLAISTGLIQS